MGLDMYLNGRKFLYTDWDKPEAERRAEGEDGFEVRERILNLGYWRKHPNLHGYIVQTFADGVDECQDIHLCLLDLEKILLASEADQLPATEGFFFGESRPEDKAHTREVIEAAIKWLKAGEQAKRESRSVIYRASW